MFSENLEQIEQLRASDRNFSRLYDKHSALDAEIQALVARKAPSLQLEIEKLKKQKLALKEEMYTIMREVEPVLVLKQQQNYLNQAKLAQMSGMRLNA